MNTFTVSREKCKGCGLCERHCPSKLIEVKKCGAVYAADCSSCHECFHCQVICPNGSKI